MSPCDVTAGVDDNGYNDLVLWRLFAHLIRSMRQLHVTFTVPTFRERQHLFASMLISDAAINILNLIFILFGVYTHTSSLYHWHTKFKSRLYIHRFVICGLFVRASVCFWLLVCFTSNKKTSKQLPLFPCLRHHNSRSCDFLPNCFFPFLICADA